MIGGFRSDLSITRKTDGNVGNVSAGVFFFPKSRINENGDDVHVVGKASCASLAQGAK